MIFFLVLAIILIYFGYVKYYTPAIPKALPKPKQVIQPKQIIRSRKSYDYILNIKAKINYIRDLPENTVILSYHSVPLITFTNKYVQQIISSSIVYGNKASSNEISFNITQNILQKYQSTTPNEITKIQSSEGTEINIHIVSTNNKLEIYLDNKPNIFFPICNIKIIPENLELNPEIKQNITIEI